MQKVSVFQMMINIAYNITIHYYKSFFVYSTHISVLCAGFKNTIESNDIHV